MDNDDTIRNLITYGDENKKNDDVQENDAGDKTIIFKAVSEDKTVETLEENTPAEGESSLDSIEDESAGEEYFSDDNKEEDDEVSDYEEDEEEIVIPPVKKSRKGRIALIITAAAVLVIAAAFALTDSGAIGKYKRNAANNIAKILYNMGIDFSKTAPESSSPLSDTSAITEDSVDGAEKKEQTKVKATPSTTVEPQYKTEAAFSNMVPFDGAADASVAAYKKGVVCARTNYLCYVGASGEKEWEVNTSVIDPILKAAGDYIFIAQEGGNKLCLYNGQNLLYDTDSESEILSCSVSSNGDAVIVTNKQSYKGAFSVYNRSGSEIYAWSSGDSAVLSADIAASSRRVAASLLNTDGKVYSTISLFNINKSGSYASVDFDDTVLFDVKFCGDDINAFGDNSMIGMSTGGNVLYDKRFDDVELTNYAVDSKGIKIMAFNSENIPMMNVYNSAGSLKYTEVLRSRADYVDMDSYNIIYNDNRDVYLGKPNSKNISKYTASMDIKRLILIDSRTFAVVYSNSIEFVRM